MTPTGWHDPTRFADAVMRFSPAAEPWGTSLARLEEAVRTDALALGVPAELTPVRVHYAYRHHPALGVREGGRVPKRRRATPDEIIAKLEARHEVRKYWDDMERRVRRMKEEGLTE